MDIQPRILGDRYEVGRLLGRGGMAVVHLGKDLRLGREVAIKMLRTDLTGDGQAQKRFRREAQSAAALNHPGIVAVYDTGEHPIEGFGGHRETIPYIVMEYVQGRTLREVLQQRIRAAAATSTAPVHDTDSTAVLDRTQQPTPPEAPGLTRAGAVRGAFDVDEACRIVAVVLSALEYSHSMGIVHRDIKAANVMMRTDGDVKVMDFGIARALADTNSTVTATQAVVGTAQYLSPEQARGEDVDARSDLYSTGCLLYELLTGMPPFTGESSVAIAVQHVRDTPRPPSHFNPAVGDELDRVVLHALAKDRDARYPDAAAFRTDLLSAVHGRPVAAPPTRALPVVPPPPEAPGPPEPDRRSWGAVVVWTILGLLVLGVLAWWLVPLLNRAEPVTTHAVPDVVTMTADQARQVLEDRGFGYAEGSPQAHEVIPRGSVISQDPRADTQAPAGQEVTVILSTGSTSVDVPDVRGRTQQEARDQVEAAGLKVADVSTQDSGTVPKDRVISTNPAAGTSVPRDSEVAIVLSSGQVSVPNVTNCSYARAREQLLNLGLKTEQQTIETTEHTEGTVVSQAPSAGSRIDQGGVVVLTVARAPVTPSPTPTPTPTVTETIPTVPTTDPGEPEPEPDPIPQEEEEGDL